MNNALRCVSYFQKHDIDADRHTVVANHDESTADAIKAEAERDVVRLTATLRRLRLFPRNAKARMHALQNVPLMMLAIVIEKMREVACVDDADLQEQIKALEEVLIALWSDNDPATDASAVQFALDRFFMWFRYMAHKPLADTDVQIVNLGVDADALAFVVAKIVVNLSRSENEGKR